MTTVCCATQCYVTWYAGYEVPVLAKVAVKVTAMVSSTGASERNWSSYDFVHSQNRNQLTAQRASDLVYVSTNLRLAERCKQPEEFDAWATEGDEDEQEALLQESKELFMAEESEEMIDVARGVADDEYLDGSDEGSECE